MSFKNALCMRLLPDAYGHERSNYWLSCHRRTKHNGLHRVKFRDGKYRVWSNGDQESRIVAKP